MQVKLFDVDYEKIESYLNGNSKEGHKIFGAIKKDCLLYTSDAADDCCRV